MGMFLILSRLPVACAAMLSDWGDGDHHQPGDGSDDTIHAGADGGLLDGTSGNDLILGSDTVDAVSAGGGNDDVQLGTGDDANYGGRGGDAISAALIEIHQGQLGAGVAALADAEFFGADGGAGDDTLAGEAGDDALLGGSGDDSLGGGDDTLLGGAGDDWLSAVDQVRIDTDAYPPTYGDLLEGDDGNDTLTGDIGDTLTGGDGADRFTLENDGYFEGAGDAVTITDFDPSEDVLQVTFSEVFHADGYAPGDISFGLTRSDDGTSTLVQVDGDTAAVIVGLTPGQIPAGAIDFSAYDAGA